MITKTLHFFVHGPHDRSVIVFGLWHKLNAAESEWERSSVLQLRATLGEWGTETKHKAHILVISSEREIKDASHKERERRETTSTSAQYYKRKKERKKTVKRHTSKQAVEKKTVLFKQQLKVSFKDKMKKKQNKK